MGTLLLVFAGTTAGLIGSLLGMGGGIMLVPLLVLGFGVPMEEAVPASLVCVVASSCGAAANFVENKLADVRLAMTLELATVAGALLGGLVAAFIPPAMLAVGFGLFALYVALNFLLVRTDLGASTATGYTPVNYPLGIGGSLVAGGVSALLGVGGGPLKVPLMAFGMRVPFKVASATSNLMIGVTAAASVVGYAFRGQLQLNLAAPLVVGVLVGANVGSRLMVKAKPTLLKRLFALVLIVVAAQMLWRGGRVLWPNL
ncbi:MAG: sulfite exporter TauE/SafE family protein [Myxococcaceae bacterium]